MAMVNGSSDRSWRELLKKIYIHIMIAAFVRQSFLYGHMYTRKIHIL